MSEYGYITKGDYEEASAIYKEIQNINLFSLDNVCYNFHYSSLFINSNLKVLYRILDIVDDGILIVDKKYKYFSFEEIIKIIYDFKKTVIIPMIINLFTISSKTDVSGSNDHEKILRDISMINEDMFKDLSRINNGK